VEVFLGERREQSQRKGNHGHRVVSLAGQRKHRCGSRKVGKDQATLRAVLGTFHLIIGADVIEYVSEKDHIMLSMEHGWQGRDAKEQG
jgi:hypothetical protein